MARRRGLDKFRAPEPEPTPQAEAQGAPPAGEQAPAAGAKREEKPFESERLMLFGPPRTQKNILVLALIGLIVSGLIYVVTPPEAANAKLGLRVVPLIFVMIHGALLGMLLGQLILVYPDGLIVLFTLMAIVIGESIYGAARWSALEQFVFNRQRLQEILAILFWAGFVGFWFGFIFFVKRLRARERFQKRYTS